jgi:CRISPR/Cas system CSM-associated protein Csm3 (group 7 of RAMP superfamily)
LRESPFATRAGILAALRNRAGADVPAGDVEAALRRHPPRRRPRLVITVEWEPVGPLMVKSGHEGIAVDVLPLVGALPGGLALVLPGSSVKGALRSRAECIVRTLLGLDLPPGKDPRKRFLRALEVPLVDELFGLRGTGEPNPEGDGPLAGLGALGVDDCYATAIPGERWEEVERATAEGPLRQALDGAGLRHWQQAFHVAVDRWTGGAAESFLYSVLEPDAGWEPLVLTVDLDRLPGPLQQPALALLLLVLRDLGRGRLPLGFATHRGMGAVRVKAVRLEAQEALDGLDVSLPGGELGHLPAGLRVGLNGAWQAWLAEQGVQS